MQAAVLRTEDVQRACALGDLLLDWFGNREDSSFFTSQGHETLVIQSNTGLDLQGLAMPATSRRAGPDDRAA